MRADAESYYAGARGIAALLLGMFLPPIAWALHLNASFTLTHHLCDSGAGWVLHLTTIAALLLALAGGLLAWRNWHATGGREAPRHGILARSHFFAIAGLASTVFFVVIIAATEVPTWFLSPCD